MWLALGLANSAQNAMFSNGLCSDVLLTGSGATCPTNATCLPGSGCTACADDLWCGFPRPNSAAKLLCNPARRARSTPPSLGSATNRRRTSKGRTCSRRRAIPIKAGTSPPSQAMRRRTRSRPTAPYALLLLGMFCRRRPNTGSRATADGRRLVLQLVTGDPNDIAITPGVHQVVIWAMGEFIGGEYYKHRTDTRASYILDFGMSCTFICAKTVNSVRGPGAHPTAYTGSAVLLLVPPSPCIFPTHSCVQRRGASEQQLEQLYQPGRQLFCRLVGQHWYVRAWRTLAPPTGISPTSCVPHGGRTQPPTSPPRRVSDIAPASCVPTAGSPLHRHLTRVMLSPSPTRTNGQMERSWTSTSRR